MAFSFTVNQTPATGGFAMYLLIAKLLASGWLNKSDSDGTTYNATGGQVTGGGTGAHGLNNTNAWVRLQRPDGVAEMIIQRGSASTVWRIKYSGAAKFVTGSPSATQTPAATDEGLVAGGGTDASPQFGTLFTTDNTYRIQVGADGAAPYGWFLGGYTTAGAAATTALLYEPLTLASPGDTDPYVFYAGVSSPWTDPDITTENAPSAVNSSKTVGYIGTPSTANWVAVPAMKQTDNSGTKLYPFGAGVDPSSSKDNVAPIRFGRPTTLAPPNGDKGTSRNARWAGVQRAASGDTGTFSSSLDRILFTSIWLPWDGVTTPT